MLLCIAAATMAPFVAAKAQPTLTDTKAFEHADATSFYAMDACGNDLDGRLYRRALLDKFLHCPFADSAKDRFKLRIAAQYRVSRARLQNLIDDVGGLPTQLPGMAHTCNEQMASAQYQQLHAVLQRYASGDAAAGNVFPAACDAADIQP